MSTMDQFRGTGGTRVGRDAVRAVNKRILNPAVADRVWRLPRIEHYLKVSIRGDQTHPRCRCAVDQPTRVSAWRSERQRSARGLASS